VPSGTKFNAAGSTATVLSHVIATQPTMALISSLSALTTADRAALAAYIAQNVPAISVVTNANTPKSIDVSSHITLNTISFDGVQVVSGPASGTLSAFSGTSVTYTPNTNFSGIDSFTYRGVLNSVQQGDPRTVTITVNGAPALSLIKVQSRKVHGAAGPFNVDINPATPITGAIDIEPRAIGGGHQIVFKFDNPPTSLNSLSVLDANLQPVGIASPSFAGNELLVTLTGIADGKRVTITATGVNNALTVSASVGFLYGDVNASRSVTAADIAYIKALSGQPFNSAKFKADINTDGAVTTSDVSAVKAQAAKSLP
jgi:hypothetical protein